MYDEAEIGLSNAYKMNRHRRHRNDVTQARRDGEPVLSICVNSPLDKKPFGPPHEALYERQHSG
jgi:hypothetical protein